MLVQNIVFWDQNFVRNQFFVIKKNFGYKFLGQKCFCHIFWSHIFDDQISFSKISSVDQRNFWRILLVKGILGKIFLVQNFFMVKYFLSPIFMVTLF